MLKINPGIVFGGGVGVGVKERELEYCVVGVPPASPLSPPTSLLVLPKPQGTVGEPFPLPRPEGAPNNSMEEESGHYSRSWAC